MYASDKGQSVGSKDSYRNVYIIRAFNEYIQYYLTLHHYIEKIGRDKNLQKYRTFVMSNVAFLSGY